MATPAEKAQAQQLFEDMLADGQKLSNISARCDQAEIDAVHALRKGEITPERRTELLAITGEIRRLAARKFAAETLFPRR